MDDLIRIEGCRLPLGQSRFSHVEAPGVTVADIVDRLGAGAPTAVQIDGEPLPPERWPHTKPEGGSVVSLAPEADGDFIIGALIATVLGVASSLLLPRPQAPDSPSQVDRIEGGSNRLRPWEPMPILFGQLRYAPPAANAWIPYEGTQATAIQARLGALPGQYFTYPSGSTLNNGIVTLPDNTTVAMPGAKIVGGSVVVPFGFQGAAAQHKQWVHGLLLWTVGRCDVSDIWLGKTPASDYGNGVSLNTAVGDNSDFANAVRLVELGADLNGATTIKRRLGIVESSVRVNLAWPQGLFRTNNKGEIHGFDDSSKAEKRPVGLVIKLLDATTNAELAKKTVSAVGGSTETPLFEDHTLNIASPKEVVLSVERQQQARDSLKIQDDLTIHSAVIPLSDQPIAISTTNTAVRIQATDQLAGTIPPITGLCTAHHPDWDKATQTWVTRATRNPASAYRAVLMGSGLSKAVAASEINMAQLQDWHEWCEIEGFTYDYLHLRRESLETVLERIAMTGRARPAWPDGKRGVAIDRRQPHWAQVFTPANCRSLKAERAGADVPHMVRCRFRDRDKDYELAEVRVYRPGYTADTATVVEQRSLDGITRRDTVSAMLAYQLRSQLARREQYTATVDWEHLAAAIGNRVGLLHDAVTDDALSGRVLETNAAAVGVTQTFQADSRTVLNHTATDKRVNLNFGADAIDEALLPAGQSGTTLRTVCFGAPHEVNDWWLIGINTNGGDLSPTFESSWSIKVTVDRGGAFTFDHSEFTADSTQPYGWTTDRAAVQQRLVDVFNAIIAGSSYSVTLGADVPLGANEIAVRTDFGASVRSGVAHSAAVRRMEDATVYAVALPTNQDDGWLWLRGGASAGRPDVEVGDLIGVYQSGTGIEHTLLESVRPLSRAQAQISLVQYGGEAVFAPQSGYTVVYIDPVGGIEEVPFGVFENRRKGVAALQLVRSIYRETLSKPARPTTEGVPTGWVESTAAVRHWVSRQILTVYPLVADPAPATYQLAGVDIPTGSEIDAGPWSEPELQVRDNWLTGTTDPDNSLGVNGQFYLNTVNKTVWHKVNGVWVKIFDAPDGGRWLSGNGAPADTLGEDDQFYLDEDTGDVYLKQDGSWTLVNRNVGQVVGISASSVKATLPSVGDGHTFDWEYDVGIDSGTVDWTSAGTTTSPEKTISNLRDDQQVTVRARWKLTSASDWGGWTLVGVGFTLLQDGAPSAARSPTISVNSATGVFTLNWTGPSDNGDHTLFRYGVRLWRDGSVVEWLGKSDTTTTRTTLPQLHAGNYRFDVRPISKDADSNQFRGPRTFSGSVFFPGINPADLAEKWHFGSGAPAANIGKDGDSYLDTALGDIYRKSNAAWAKVYDAPDDAVWHSGSGAPSSSLGENGDFYLDFSSGDIYLKSNGAWSLAPLYGGQVVGVTSSSVKATVASQGANYTYDWEYDEGDDPATINWVSAGTTTTPEKTITGLLGDTAYTVRARWKLTSASDWGGWTLVGVGYTLLQDGAPSAARSPTISVNSATGVFTLNWNGPSDNGDHTLFRYGCRLLRDGVVVEWLGKNDTTTTRTTLPQLHAGNYRFEVTPVSSSNGKLSGTIYRGPTVVSSSILFTGLSPADVVPEATTTTKGKVELSTYSELKSGTRNKVPDAHAVEAFVEEKVDDLDDALATVAKSGRYSDLSGRPTIPSVPSTIVTSASRSQSNVGDQTIASYTKANRNSQTFTFARSGGGSQSLSFNYVSHLEN